MSARCTTCGFEVGERLVCPNCGTLVAAERRLARMSATAQAYASQKLDALPRRITINHFLWACALMPVFVLPPAVSLAYALSSMRRPADSTKTNCEWLAIISILNIALSLLLLYRLHFSPVEVALFIGGFVRALFRDVLHLLPGQGQPPQPRLIPA